MKTENTSIVSSSAINTNLSIQADIQIKNDKFRIFFRSDQEALSEKFESFLASAILPVMSVGRGKLIVEGEVSQLLISRLSTIQNTYSLWEPRFHPIEIEIHQPVASTTLNKNRVGTFFSGGVDSFYTLLKHQDEITDLVFVHGLDIQLEHQEYRKKISKSVQEIAAHFGKNLIEIETNIRELFDSYISYPKWGWSIALAAIGHLLRPNINHIYIPIGHTYVDLFPTGSRLLPLWSAETFEFINDGYEASRVEKVSLISEHDIVLQNLRICHRKPDNALNCGRCEKCIRTMINLEVSDALNCCSVFESELDIKRVLKINAIGESKRSFIKRNLNALEKIKGDEDLIVALRSILKRPRWLQITRKGLRKLQRIISNRINKFKQ